MTDRVRELFLKVQRIVPPYYPIEKGHIEYDLRRDLRHQLADAILDKLAIMSEDASYKTSYTLQVCVASPEAFWEAVHDEAFKLAYSMARVSVPADQSVECVAKANNGDKTND